MSEVETEFLLPSEAAARLGAGMFSGPITRSEPVKKLKEKQPRLSVGWGPQSEKAAADILTATLEGDLAVHVLAQSPVNGGSRSLVVPVDFLQSIPKVRGGLPDHPGRLPVSFLRTHPDVFAALSKSKLYLQRTEFYAWYKKQKRRGRWLSQRTSKKRQRKRKQPPGRPTKITNELLTSIRALVAQGKWSAPDGIAKLATLLASNGAPLRNTLRRAVDLLYLETGDPRYHIIPRKRPKAKSAKPANLVSVRKHLESDGSVIRRRSDFEGAPTWTKENRGRYDRSRLRYPSDLTDEEWALVEPLIAPAKRGGNKRTVDVREVVNGLMYLLSTGCQWRAIPKDLPPRSTVHDYFDMWACDGTLDRIHHVLYDVESGQPRPQPERRHHRQSMPL